MDQKTLDKSLAYLKDWLRFRAERVNVPGFVVAVAHRGKVVFNEAYGFADLEKKTQLTSDHLFRIASQSKTFTATALMRLQEQGKLSIDELVVKYVPWLKKHTDSRMHKMTIKQLMSHSAGFIRDGLDADYWLLERPFPDGNQLQQEILEADLVIDGGQKMKYSNLGYGLLGEVVEAASGQVYNQYVTEHIVDELGLKNTGPELDHKAVQKLVTGYGRQEPGNVRLPIANIDTRALSAATGFYANSADICSYYSAHFLGSGKLLSDASKKAMQATQWKIPHNKKKGEYGLGLAIDHLNKQRVFGHGGGFPGHSTKTYCDPGQELVVVILTNSVDSSVNDIARGMFSTLHFFQTHKGDTQPALEKFAGRYVDLWNFVDILPVGEKVFISEADSWGAIDDVEELQYIDEQTLQIGETDGYGAEGELLRFTFDSSGKVVTVRDSGFTRLPEKEFYRRQALKKQIG